MNTTSLFVPKMHMMRALKESVDFGLTRIEISYYADSSGAESELWKSNTATRMHQDLDKVAAALATISGICYRLPLNDLLQEFQKICKGRQLYVQMPHLCALVYAKNGRRGCCTGFFKNIPKTGPFNHKTFLLANALPGPDSVITCVIRKKGKGKPEQ